MSEENIEQPVKRTRALKVESVTREEYEKLKACIEKLAVMSGQGNILNEFGLERWIPSKADTRRKW